MKKHLNLITIVCILIIIALLLSNQKDIAVAIFCLTILIDGYQIFILKERIKDLEHPQY